MNEELRKALNTYGANHPHTQKLIKAMRKAAPKGVDEAKYKRCKDQVKEQSPGVNEYAVCAASLQGKVKKSTDDLVEELMDVAYEHGWQIEKGGEGSRGGKVIGHTRSGKPIYEGGHTKGMAYKPADHEDAASAHNKMAQKYEQESKKYRLGGSNPDATKRAEMDSKQRHHGKIWREHDRQKQPVQGLAQGERGQDLRARTTVRALMKPDVKKSLIEKLLKAATGEGSRGGKVIGHTKSGKPIYEKTGDRKTKDYDAQDHHHAYIAHHMVADRLGRRAMNMNPQDRRGDREKAKLKQQAEHHGKQSAYHREKMEAHQALGAKLKDYGQAMGDVKLTDEYKYDPKKDG